MPNEVDDILEGFDPTPEAPPTVDDALIGFDPTPEHNPERDKTLRTARDTVAAIDASALAAGERTVSQRPDFAPPISGSRNYLSEWAGGLLDLNDNALSAQDDDILTSRYYREFEARNPHATSVLRDPASAKLFGTDPKVALKSHLRAIVRLGYSAPTPQEVLSAGDAATADWTKAAAAGTITGAFGKVTLPDVQAALPAARDIYAKLQGRPFGDLSVLDPVERTAFEALGGNQWLQFVNRHARFYIGRSRRDRLLGAPTPTDAPPPTISTFGESSIPTEPPLAFEDLENVSSFARTLLGAGRAVEAQEKLARAAEENAYGYQFPGNIIGADPHRALSKFFGLHGRPEDPAEAPQGGAWATSNWLTNRGRAAGFAFANTLSAGGQALATVLPPVLNFATLGGFEQLLQGVKTAQQAVSSLGTGVYSLTDNLISGNYADVAADPHVFDRGVTAMTTGAARLLATWDESAGRDDRKIADTVEFLESSFPDLTDEARRELRTHYLGGHQAISSFMRRASEGTLGLPVELATKVLRLDSPYAQKVAAETLGPGLDSPEGWVFTALGVRQTANALLGRGKIPRRPDPKMRGSFTDFETKAAEAGHASPLAPALRASLLDDITARLHTFTDEGARTAFTERFQEVMKQQDEPISPEKAAAIKTSIGRYQAAADDLQNTKLSASGRAAFRELAEHVSEFPLFDQQFILTGDEAYFGKASSLAKGDRAKKWYIEQSRTTEALEIPRQMDRSPEKVLQIQSGLQEYAARNGEFAARRERFLSVTDRLVANLAAEVDELDNWAAQHSDVKASVTSSYNSYVRGLTQRNLDLETNGGSVSRPSPLSRHPATQRLATALSDGGKKLEALLTDRDLATPERKALSEALASATPETREGMIAEWARTELRARTTPTSLDVAASSAPKSDLATALLAKIDEAAAAGERVKLTSAESRWINQHAAAYGDKPLSNFIADITQALDDTAKKATVDRDRSLSLAEAVRNLQDQARAATAAEGFKIKMSKALRKDFEEALARSDFPTDRGYIALAADATDNELSALAAARESIDDFTATHRAIESGVLRVNSLDMAAFAQSAPHILYHELQKHDRAALGVLHGENYTAKLLAKRFGRKLSAEEQIRVFREIESGKPSDDPTAILMQEQRLRLLDEMVNVGKLSPERYADIVGRPYQHYMYDRAQQARFAKTGQPGLAVDPGALKFRIPDKGEHYVTWQDKAGKFHTKDGFATVEEANAWFTENAPDGIDPQVLGTWSRIDREMHNLVEDVRASHLSMAQQMALSAHNGRIAAYFAQTPHVKRASDVLDLVERGEGKFIDDNRRTFETSDGERYTLWRSPNNPWLEGRYVHPSVEAFFQEFKAGYGIVNELTKAAQETAPVRGKYIDPGTIIIDALGKGAHAALKGATNSLTFTKVALSIPTIRGNWMSNLIQGKMSGVNIFSPVDLVVDVIPGTIEYFRSLFSSDRFLKDPDVKFLQKNDLVRWGNETDWHNAKGRQNSRAVEALLDKHWRPAQAIQARIDDTKRRLGEDGLSAADGAKLEAKLAQLNADLEAASRPLARAYFGVVFRHAQNLVSEVTQAIFKGEGKLNSWVWSTVYPEVTGDRLMKYLVARKHRRLGIPEDESASIIADNMQQLHRAPAAIRKIGRTTGGAMFGSYFYDQGRIYGNALTKQPWSVVKFLLMLGGWNAAAIAASGQSPEDYLEAYAISRGVRRDLVSDLQGLLGGLKIPGGLGPSEKPGNIYDLALGPIWDWATPKSKAGRNLSAIIKESFGADNATAGALIDGAVGVASKLGLADVATFIINTIGNQEDERGNPIRDFGDLAATFGRQFLAIRGLPGSHEFDVLSRAAQGTEVNRNTGRKVPFREAFMEFLLKAETDLDTPSRFRSSLMQQIRDRGLTADFRRTEHEDNLLSTGVDREARKPDGTLDYEKAYALALEHARSNPKYHRVPTATGGTEKVIDSFDEKDIYKSLSDLGKPRTIRLFSKQSLATQISTYGLWRSIDPDAPKRDQDWYLKVRQVLFDKVTSRRTWPPSEVREVFQRIDELLNSGRLTSDAVSDLTSFRALLSKKISKGGSR